MTTESPQQRLIDRIEERERRDRITVNPTAALVASEHYESMTGEVDDLAFAAAVLIYLEVASP